MSILEQAENLMQAGAFDQAEEILHSILFDEPDDLKAICDIGIVYTERGKNDEAVKALCHYLDRDQNNPAAWEALGCAYFRKTKFKKALTCFDKALEIKPRNPSVLRNKGVLLGVMGKRQKGYDLIQDSYYLKPDDFRTLYALSYIHKEFGFRVQARRAMEKLLTMTIPDDIRKDTVVNLIKFDLNWE